MYNNEDDDIIDQIKCDLYRYYGNNVYIGLGSKILGNITIGNNDAIGANAVAVRGSARGVPLNGSESYIMHKVEEMQ